MRNPRNGRRAALVRAAIAVAIITLVALMVLPGAFAGTGTGAPGSAGPNPAPAAAGEFDGSPVVVVGMTGVRWDDVSAAATPALFSLLGDGSTGNLISRSVRSSACPADGWLAVSAGRRAADLPMTTRGTCRKLFSPGADGVVPGWPDYLEAAAAGSYDAVPGLLGEQLRARGSSVLGLGPGAAIALAGSDGIPVGDYAPAAAATATLGGQVAGLLPGHDLAVVDIGSVGDRNRPFVYVDEGELQEETPPAPAVPDLPSTDDWILSAPTRAEQVASIEAKLGAVLAAVRETSPGAVVLVVSLADSGTVPRMQVAAMVAAPAANDGAPQGEGVGGAAAGVLGSSSTRQYGMVQATDVAPTILSLLSGESPTGMPGMPGVPMRTTGAAPSNHLFRLTDAAVHSLTVRPLVPGFFTFLVVINILLYGAAAFGLNRAILGRLQASARRMAALGRALLLPDGTTRLLRSLRTTGAIVAAVPVASYLANLVPWWRAPNPGLTLWGLVLFIAVVIGLVALLGPWRHHLLAPLAVVAGLTFTALVVDVLTGATLQVSALMGVQPLVGGRFYGFNNSSFALHATASLLVAMCVAEPLVRRGRTWVAAGLIAVIGIVATVLDGHPSIGADFGGPPALIPSFAILVLLTLGVRITWKRLAAVLGGSALLAISFSVLDWLRPPDQRTHLGNFIQTVLDGGLWNVIARKAGQNLTNLFGSTLTVLAVAGVVVLVVVIARPLGRAARGDDPDANPDPELGPQRAGRMRRALAGYEWLSPRATVGRLTQDSVMLQPGIVALSTAWVIGFALNDSGVVVPAIGMSLAVPLLLSVVATWLLRVRVAHAGRAGVVAGQA